MQVKELPPPNIKVVPFIISLKFLEFFLQSLSRSFQKKVQIKANLMVYFVERHSRI